MSRTIRLPVSACNRMRVSDRAVTISARALIEILRVVTHYDISNVIERYKTGRLPKLPIKRTSDDQPVVEGRHNATDKIR
ncbi:hypothetical protein CEXT_581091 [Caerostris extrusa]|uniref:Uncharacterized protein n=1 Tax=Caerostris extrusa TaxID=172846 RepID=A0AAV4R1U8_CAEEX|nr:hypothetical protein CEXT_581091 [Caerostris extrusa]